MLVVVRFTGMAWSVTLVNTPSVLFMEQSTPGSGSGEMREDGPHSFPSVPDAHTLPSMPYRSWKEYGVRTALVALTV